MNRTSYEAPHYAVFSSLSQPLFLVPNIILSSLFTDTVILR